MQLLPYTTKDIKDHRGANVFVDMPNLRLVDKVVMFYEALCDL